MRNIWVRLSDKDLDFLIETVHPEVIDKLKLRQIIREDEAFRNTFIADEKVFRRLMDDEEIFLKISPTLFFEVLLRRVVNDLKGASYTLERTSTMKIPIFDTKDQKSSAHFVASESFSRTSVEVK